ncbi:carboxymuconolactone decarboxylase family protein [Herpetosiphon llansteffanensis]|uniref:carboxymuconolactone decarboxylase family protein n=1 Tax=Herpetosiphon llansteffanensis TaxID=2094568 RepID=UPI000D7C961A|nr:peroxidase-related enzyme [Herpetosiphon llansteffanensis]
MPRLKPLAPNEVDPAALKVFEGFYAKRGNVPNMFRTFARRPEMMIAASNLMSAVLSTGTLDLRLKEMVVVRTSQLNECAYCLTSHSTILRNLGLSQENIDALQAPDDSRWTERERVALRYAEQVTVNAKGISDELWASLREHFDEGEIVELTATTSLFSMFNRFNDALDMAITEPGWPEA